MPHLISRRRFTMGAIAVGGTVLATRRATAAAVPRARGCDSAAAPPGSMWVMADRHTYTASLRVLSTALPSVRPRQPRAAGRQPARTASPRS